MCELWANEFEAKAAAGRSRLDPGLVREAMALFRGLPTSAEREVLLCTDLHPGNVLAAEREPWLVIDPKPYVGEPTYDALQHMLNCDLRLHSDPDGLVRRMADLFGLEADRLLLWLSPAAFRSHPTSRRSRRWPGGWPPRSRGPWSDLAPRRGVRLRNVNWEHRRARNEFTGDRP